MSESLLTGATRERALEALADIATEVTPAIERWADAHDAPSGAHAHSLAWGRAGVALFHAYREVADLGGGDDAVTLLERAIDAVGECDPDATLFTGFPGVAWVGEHFRRLAGAEPGDRDEDANADVDAILDEGLLAAEDASLEWDLVEGLSGIAVYAHERLPRGSGRALLEKVVAALALAASRETDGLAWRTPMRRRRVALAVEEPEWDLGIAHGVPGVIAALGLAVEAGARVDEATRLLDGAVSWLLAQRLPAGEISCFASFAGPGVAPVPARCAWCYGDPGVAAALLGAARRAGRPEWEEAARGIARTAAAVRERRDDVIDAQFCHGAAGIAHVFLRLHRATGDGALADAARYWFERALGMRRPGHGLAGFRTWTYERTREGEWMDDPRLLTGIAGTGLALLGAVADLEPDWDRAFLLSVPGRG